MGDTNLVLNNPLDIEGLYEIDSPPTFKKSRFDRIITNFLVPPESPQPILIGDHSHSDHSGLIMTLNLASQ